MQDVRRVCGGQTHMYRLLVGCEHMHWVCVSGVCRLCAGCVQSVCRVCIG